MANRILNAVKLDYLTGRSFLALYPVFFLVGLLIGTLVKMPIFTVVLVIVLAVFIVGGVFSNQEKNHGEKLYGTLPLRRRDVVVGRYVYGLIIGVAGTVIAGVLGWLASTISGADMGQLGPKRATLGGTPGLNHLIFWFAIGFAFAYFCFAIGVAFPIYFRFGFSKAYIFTMLPLYLVVLISLLVTRAINPGTIGTSNTVVFFVDHVYLLPVIGVVLGLVLWSISLAISSRVYAHKEI